MEYEVTMSLSFEVTVPVSADTKGAAEDMADDMSLSEILGWSGCASYDCNIVNIREV